LWQKRLEIDKFAWPRDPNATIKTCTLAEFGWLMEGFDLIKNKPHKTLIYEAVS
jgi:hypothetical protein